MVLMYWADTSADRSDGRAFPRMKKAQNDSDGWLGSDKHRNIRTGWVVFQSLSVYMYWSNLVENEQQAPFRILSQLGKHVSSRK